jgi:predicted DNA-binding transcriptional regulator AlpA
MPAKKAAQRTKRARTPVFSPTPKASEADIREWYGTPQVCGKLGVDRSTLWRWMTEGRFPRGVFLAGSSRPRWHRDDLARWEAEQRAATVAA